MTTPTQSQPQTASNWSPPKNQLEGQSPAIAESSQPATHPLQAHPFVLPPPPATPPGGPADIQAKPKGSQESLIDLTKVNLFAGSPPPQPPATPNPVIQAKCATCEAEEKETPIALQAKSDERSPTTLQSLLGAHQPSLPKQPSITPKAPAYQRSAIDLIDLPLSTPTHSRSQPPLASPAPLASSPPLSHQRQATDTSMVANTDVEGAIARSRGQGQPLTDTVRRPMEQAFGANFSGVRIHTDRQADGLNQSLQAKAFTTGQDIYFKQGEFKPGSHDGQKLLAHELTHTIQQTGKQIRRKPNKPSQVHFKQIQRRTVASQATEPVTSEAAASASASTASMGVQPTHGQEPSGDRSPGQSQPQHDSAEQRPNAASQSSSAQGKQAPAANTQTAGETTVFGSPAASTATPEATENMPPAGDTTAAGDTTTASSVRDASVSTMPTSTAGGSAVSGDPAAAATPSQTTATVPQSAEADPDFQTTVNQTKAAATAGKAHAPAATKSQEAQAAAVSPPIETASKAQANQVGAMEQAETPGFNKAAFKTQLMEKIAAAAPKTLKEADEFKDGGKLGAVKGEMTGQVTAAQEASQKPLAEKAKQAPDTSGIEPKPVTPLPPSDVGNPVTSVGASKAVPKPLTQTAVETPLQQESQQLDQQMAEADVTDEQLANANEPDFKAALDAKQVAKTNATEAPKTFRQDEQGELSQAQAEAGTLAQQKLQGMHGDRTQLLAQVANQQVGAKGQDEQARAKVAGEIQTLYDTTKGKVEAILNGIDGKINPVFDKGAADAQKVFEDHVAERMKAYKDERYSSWLTGTGRWIKDQFMGLPSEVNAFYTEGRNLYLKAMDGVIDQVVDIVATELTNAKAEVAKGRQEVQTYVAQLPQDLQTVGQEAATNIQSQFDSLEQSVDAKQTELIDTLANKYNEKLKAVDDRITQMKQANKGLVDKAAGAITGVINTIKKLKNMLTSVLKGAASAVKGIIKDPIGFLGNLIGGIKQGFDNFVGKIGEHLQGGLIGWLTGAMGAVGLQIPKDIFSLPGIFDLVMQILGLSWNYIRTKAVKLMGEPVVAAAEKTFEVFTLLQEKGVFGLWEYVKEQFTDLKETVIEAIKNMVITQVITAGVKWILGLLNPASAFVKACMLIYDIIMFFVNQGSQVLGLVKAVIDGVKAIASGSVGAVAKAIEGALVKSLPVVIGFLASLLGVGGLAGKVQGIVKKIRGRIDGAIDKILLKAKKLFKGKIKKKKLTSSGGKEKAVETGLRSLKVGEKKYIKDKKISKENAIKVAQETKRRHAIFKEINVIDGGKDWDYDYSIQRTKAESLAEGKEEDNTQIIKKEDISIQESSVSDRKEWELVFAARGITLGKVEMLLSDKPKKAPDDVFMVVAPSKDAKNISVHPPGTRLEDLLKSEAKEAYTKTPVPGVEEEREISRADIFSTFKKSANTISISLYVKVEKQNVWWGSAIIHLDKADHSKASAEHLLGATDKTIYADKVSRLRIKEGDRFTQVAIEETNKIYNQHSGRGDVPLLEAQLDEYNRFMFQITYVETGSPEAAVSATPFAKGRIPLGYTEFVVEKMEAMQDVDFSAEVERFPYAKASTVSLAKRIGSRSVPTKILVTAKKDS